MTGPEVPPRRTRGPGRRLLATAGLGLSGWLWCCAPAAAESLQDAIASALASNPRVAQFTAELRIAQEHVVQAQAQYGPTVSVQADTTHQGPGSSITPDYQSAAVQLNQPLFSGGRIRSDVSASAAEQEASAQALRQEMNQIVLDTVSAYAALSAAVQIVGIREQNLQALQTYHQEMQARARIGLTSATDAAQAEASLHNAQLDVVQAQQQVQQGRNAFAAVVGHPPGALEPDIDLPALPVSLEDALARAEASNPALLIARLTARASQERVGAAQAERLPNVSLNAAYGYEPLNPLAPRTPYVRNGSVTVSLSMPLYDSGLARSQVREAHRRSEADRQNAQAVRLLAIQAVANAWSQNASARQSLIYGAQAVDAAKVAYRGSQEEQKLDQRSTLEVLTAQQTLEAANINVIAAKRDVWISQASVLFQLGALTDVGASAVQPKPYPLPVLDALSKTLQAVPYFLDGLAHGDAPPKPAP